MHWDNSRKPSGTPRRVHAEGTARSQPKTDEVCVRLTRKFADMIDGVNLQHASVGDHLELSKREADMLIAEGWAERSDDRPVRRLPRRATAAENHRRPRQKPKS
jgi:hypothetical protein